MKNLKRILPAVVAIPLIAITASCQRQVEMIQKPEDTMPPYINLTQYEFYTEVGTPIDFSNIGGYDDIDGMLPTRLRGYVDYTTPGDYYPSIVCTDLSNNESEAVITIHVVEEGGLPVQQNAPTPEPTPSTCEKGTDPEQPCSVVLKETAEQYKTLYYGTEGKEFCEEDSGDEEYSCEVIYRNDGTFWGYGLK